MRRFRQGGGTPLPGAATLPKNPLLTQRGMQPELQRSKDKYRIDCLKRSAFNLDHGFVEERPQK